MRYRLRYVNKAVRYTHFDSLLRKMADSLQEDEATAIDSTAAEVQQSDKYITFSSAPENPSPRRSAFGIIYSGVPNTLDRLIRGTSRSDFGKAFSWSERGDVKKGEGSGTRQLYESKSRGSKKPTHRRSASSNRAQSTSAETRQRSPSPSEAGAVHEQVTSVEPSMFTLSSADIVKGSKASEPFASLYDYIAPGERGIASTSNASITLPNDPDPPTAFFSNNPNLSAEPPDQVFSSDAKGK